MFLDYSNISNICFKLKCLLRHATAISLIAWTYANFKTENVIDIHIVIYLTIQYYISSFHIRNIKEFFKTLLPTTLLTHQRRHHYILGEY